VFDSSGPEGKVRGTPQQIIDKYNQLARDAQLSGDRVATENFQQHAEHYTRMLAEAQREQNERREQQEQQARERQQARNDHQQQPRHDDQPEQPVLQEEGPQPDLVGAPQPAASAEEAPKVETPAEAGPAKPAPKRGRARRKPDPETATSEAGDVIDLDGGAEAETGLVETPEEKPKPKRKPRARKPKATEEPGKPPASDATAAE